MGVRILHDEEENMAAIYCSTTDFAFGPIFYDGDSHEDLPDDWQVKDASEIALAFLQWYDSSDVRTLSDKDIGERQSEFLNAVASGELKADDYGT